MKRDLPPPLLYRSQMCLMEKHILKCLWQLHHMFYEFSFIGHLKL